MSRVHPAGDTSGVASNAETTNLLDAARQAQQTPNHDAPDSKHDIRLGEPTVGSSRAGSDAQIGPRTPVPGPPSKPRPPSRESPGQDRGASEPRRHQSVESAAGTASVVADAYDAGSSATAGSSGQATRAMESLEAKERAQLRWLNVR